MHDLLIVGAGPSGLYLSRLCEEAGIDFLVVEKKRSAGEVLKCSGLISRNLKKFVKINEIKDLVEHKVRRAVVHCGKEKLELKKGYDSFFVIERRGFERYLASPVIEKIMFKTTAEHILVKRWEVRVKTNRGIIKSRMVAICNGASSRLARRFGCFPRKLMLGVFSFKEHGCYDEHVDIFIDKGINRDGFFWKIPRGERVEYGVLSGVEERQNLEKFFGLKFGKIYGGLVPMGPGKTYFNRAVILGDAAGMCKPWSGGGIIYSFSAARVACKVIRKAVELNNFGEGILSEYEKGWKKTIGFPIKLGMILRKVYENMSNASTRACIKVLNLLPLDLLDEDMLG